MPLKLALVDLETALPCITSPLLMPRHGVLSVGTAAARAGHTVNVWVECLNGVDESDLLNSDVVGFAVTHPNLSRVAKLSYRIKQNSSSAYLIAGGPHATISPTEVLNFVDVVVRDEAEDTIVELLNCFGSGRPITNINGISYKKDGRVIHNPRRRYRVGGISGEDLDLLTNFDANARKASLARGQVLCGYANTSRGCPFPCTFCYENMIGGTGFRAGDTVSLIEDIRRKRSFFGTDRFWFTDSNFTTNARHAREVLEAIIHAKLDCRFSILSRVDIGSRPEILDLMRAAGVVELSIGMEAIDDERLASIEKRQTVASIIKAINELHLRQMTIHGLFMVGFDGDTDETPSKIAEFCRNYGVHDFNFYCLAEYPQLPGRTLPRYRICEMNPDYYTGHFVSTFPRDVRPSALERSVFDALVKFYDPRIGSNSKRFENQLNIHAAQYLQVKRMQRISIEHQKQLAATEDRYYDNSGKLSEDFLRANPLLTYPIPPDTYANWQDPEAPVNPATSLASIEQNYSLS